MATQALYLKYRPQTFEDVIGQSHVTHTLLSMVRQNRIRHAYLFSGPRGTGKTSNARLLAKAVNCTHEDLNKHPCNTCETCRSIGSGNFLDVIEIDAASHTGVDDVRDLREKIAFAPNRGRYKVYIIDEVHRFSGAAFDALLKTLEEPPAHAIFVLATTEIDKVPATIKSRCLLFEFRRVSLREVVARLREICDAENIIIDDRSLELIGRQGTGSVRDSISLLDQIVANPDEAISYELTRQMLGAAGNRYVQEIIDALIRADTAYGLDIVNEAIDGGADPRQFGRQVIEQLRQLLLIQMGSADLVDASDDMREQLQYQASQLHESTLVHAIKAFNTAVNDLRGGWQPQLPLELAIIESTRPVVDAPAAPVRVSAPAPVKSAPVQQLPPDPQPAAPAALATASATPAGEVSTTTAAELLQHWPGVLNRAGQLDRSLAALLKHCSPMRLENDIFLIGMSSSPVLKEKIERDREFRHLTQIIKEIFGDGITVRIELTGKQSPDTGSSSGDLDNLIEQDQLLSYARDELKAEISRPDEEDL